MNFSAVCRCPVELSVALAAADEILSCDTGQLSSLPLDIKDVHAAGAALTYMGDADAVVSEAGIARAVHEVHCGTREPL